MTGARACCLVLLGGAACAPPPAPETLNFAGPKAAPSVTQSSKPADSSGDAAHATAPIEAAVHAEVAAYTPGAVVEVSVDADRDTLVVHGVPAARRALVYLHGSCGDIHAMESWASALSSEFTLIALRGDEACGGGRYRWSRAIAPLHARIARTLRFVARTRGDALDVTPVALMGYSQGASRAQSLAFHAPAEYPWVVLGGAPTAPAPYFLRRARAVAVLGGELEGTGQMRRGVTQLTLAGVRSAFWMLPGAAHGEYGPEGTRVMTESLSWLFE